MKKLLVFYPATSGIDKYLFPNLSSRGWAIKQINIDCPKYLKYVHLLSTFRPQISQWKEKFALKQAFYLKSPAGFKQRTRFCEKLTRRLKADYDLILQVSGMFASSFNGSQGKYVLFIDWTRKLSEREWPYWAPVKDEAKKGEWFRLEQNTYRNAALIFSVSEYTKKSVINDYGIAADKIVVTGYGPTLDKVPEEDLRKEYDGKTILFVGYDFKRKGGYVLLEAFKNVREEIKDVRLIIVGPANLKVGMEGVEVKGALSKEEMIKLYEQASIFVMPSLCEPFGLVFLEAMAYKLPCVGTAVDAMPEIIEDGKTGFLVKPANVDDLAKKITSLLENPRLMRGMGDAGLFRLKDNFTWDKTIGKIDVNLRRITNSGRA